MLQHVSRIHASSPSFSITCGLDGCLRTYKNNGSYQKHVKKIHSRYLNMVAESESAALADTSVDNYPEYFNDDYNFIDDCEPIPSDLSTAELQRKKQKAKWILKIRETNMLTQTCTENLLSDITNICTNIVEDLKADIVHKLTSGPITLPSIVIEEISETFDNEIYRQPFVGLETQYKQLQFYRKHLNFVVRNIMMRTYVLKMRQHMMHQCITILSLNSQFTNYSKAVCGLNV